MARVQYTQPAKGININRGLPPPKYPEMIMSWFKAARKAIPSIPVVNAENWVKAQKSGWYIFSSEPSTDFVRFTLIDYFDNKCYVIIDRKAEALGGK